MVWGAFIGAAADLLGTYMTNEAAEDRQNASFYQQKEILQNSHQWEVEDLKSAGLNPVLSANSGVSGSAPAASPVGDYSKGVSSAMQAIATAAEKKLKDKQAENVDANTKKTNAETKAVELENARRQVDSDVNSAVHDIFTKHLANSAASIGTRDKPSEKTGYFMENSKTYKKHVRDKNVEFWKKRGSKNFKKGY